MPNRNPRTTIVTLALLLTLSCSREARIVETAPAASVLFRNVIVVDGTGAPGVPGDLRIRGQRIEAVGLLSPEPGEAIVEGGGRVLAPGFIDSHSHADGDILQHRDALAAVSQGITTVVVGQDGGSPYPLSDFFANFAKTPATVNIASYAGHNTLRDAVMGMDFRRHATAAEVAEMQRMLRQELASGAIGLSSGLEYDPGINSDPSEVLALAQVAADAGTRYISHVRSEDRWFFDAIDEIIHIGRVTGMPVQISHVKLAMKSLWGQAPQLVAKLDAARKEDIDISADIYPYEYWQSNMMVLLPERDYHDRDAVAYALDQIAPPEGLWFTQFDAEPGYVGMTLSEIAAARRVDPVTAFMQLAAEAEAVEQSTGQGADSIIATSMIEDDIRQLLGWPETNVCTDGGLVDLHPRSHGAFTRVLGRYVRDEGLLSLEQAVHKMTGLTARHLGFSERGVIREGAIADLVLFDPATVADRSTPDAPDLLSAGILSVWVAGEKVYDNGAVTDARPGRVIR
ncbi:MAG: D-aminoacylase [Woeseiaceae bacterium]|nr:D-aminoacylase [Woeseiaceae bacterium]